MLEYTHQNIADMTRVIQLEEKAAIGLGHTVRGDITENMIRGEHGLRSRASHVGDMQ